MIILCYGSIMDACTVISISIKSSNLNIYPIYVKRKLFLITIYSKQLSLFHVAICWKYMIFLFSVRKSSTTTWNYLFLAGCWSNQSSFDVLFPCMRACSLEIKFKSIMLQKEDGAVGHIITWTYKVWQRLKSLWLRR